MLRSVPRSLFSWNFTVYDGEARVAEIDVAWLREEGTLTLGDVPCRVYRDGWRGAFVLEAGGHRLVEAVKPSAFYRTFELTYDGHRLTLNARSAFGQAFELRQGDQVLGTVAPERLFTRKMTADLPKTLPLAVRVFILWLVILLWKRAAAAASS